MARILKDMAVVVGTYEDRNTGQQKNRYRNIGVLMESENNGERYQYLLLDRTFNPAGVPVKAGSDKVLVSLFDQRERNDAGQQGGAQGGGYASQSPQEPDRGGYATNDSEIPF